MKALILALLVSPAYAQTFKMPNDGGGEIVLKIDPCPGYPALFTAYAYGSSGKVVNGCWQVFDDLVHVVYEGGEKRVYPPNAFIMTDKPKTKGKPDA